MTFPPIFAHHGGRIADAARAFPAAPRDWLDLSTGINPHAWPLRPADERALRALPEPGEARRLEAVAAGFFGCAPECVAAVPGAEAGLRLLPLVHWGAQAAIVMPTYGSHEAAWKDAGAEIRAIGKNDAMSDRSHILLIVNPNNPDGHLFERAFLLHLCRMRADAGLWTIIDESFIDPTPEASAASALPERTIILRSFGKFFGLPGLRLGFVIAPPAIALRIRSLFGDWPLSQQALQTGIAAYGDAMWHERTRRRLRDGMRRLEALLAQAGFTRIGGTPLFTLQRADDAAFWFETLAGHAILTRPYLREPGWLRFGLPDEAGWERLAAALQSAPIRKRASC